MQRRDRWRQLLPALIVGAGLLIVAVAVFATRGVDQTEAERDAAVGTSRALATPVLDQCARGAEAGPTPSAAECTLAGQVVAQPAPAVTGLDTTQVLQLIRAELASLKLPPGQLPTPDMVRDAAAAVLMANPDLFRGPPPTTDQVSAAAAQAVAAYFAANPVRDGRDGDSPACLSQPGQCQGAQGVGLASLTFQRRDGTCVAVAVLRDPTDGSTTETTAPVTDAVCEPVVPADPTPDPPADPTPPADSGMPPVIGD